MSHQKTTILDRKRLTLLDFLSQGAVLVYVDATQEGVALPQSLMGQAQVHLQLSYEFANEVFVIDDLGVRVSLATAELRMVCLLTWESIYYLQRLDGDLRGIEPGEVFIESVPHALLDHYGLTMRVDEQSHNSSDLLETWTQGKLPPKEFEISSNSSDDSDARLITAQVDSWITTLERLDDPIIKPTLHIADHHEVDAVNKSSKDDSKHKRSRKKTDEANTHNELSFSKILDLISTVEDVMSSASRRVRRKSKGQHARELKEGEHDPERGILSLIRMLEEQKPQ